MHQEVNSEGTEGKMRNKKEEKKSLMEITGNEETGGRIILTKE